jgi:hypothetical protein
LTAPLYKRKQIILKLEKSLTSVQHQREAQQEFLMGEGGKVGPEAVNNLCLILKILFKNHVMCISVT